MTTHEGLPRELASAETVRALLANGRAAARTQTRDEGLVEDSASHALAALTERCLKPEAPEPATWKAWVRTAALRHARKQDFAAKRQQLGGRGGSELPGRGWGGGADVLDLALRKMLNAGSLASDVAGRLDGRVVRDQMKVLDAIDQRLLNAKYVEGRTTREIADEEGLTVKAVEHRLRRARQRLQKNL